MDRAELKEIIKEAFTECHGLCMFSEEERVSMRDLVGGVKLFKKSILTILVGIILGAIAFAVRGIYGVTK